MKIRKSGFAVKGEIRKRFSRPKNLSSRWISLLTSSLEDQKKDLQHYYRKQWCSSCSMRSRARPLLSETVLSILFRIFVYMLKLFYAFLPLKNRQVIPPGKHKSSDVRHQTSKIRHLTSDIRHRTSGHRDIEHRTSDNGTSEIRHQTSAEIRHRTSDNRYRTSDIRNQASDIVNQTSDIGTSGHQDIEHRTSDNGTSEIRHQTSDIGHQTSEIRHRTLAHRTSDIRHQKSDIEN